MFRASRSSSGAAALAVAALLALGGAAGCGDEAILLTVSAPDDLRVPLDAATLTITVTAPQGGFLSQQVLGPFPLADESIGGFPFEAALLRGVVFQDEVLISVHTEDPAGNLTAAGSTLARFEDGKLVRSLVLLSRVECGDDPFEISDDGEIGASLNLLEGGNQPDLKLCANDGEHADRFNFLVPQSLGLQIVLNGSDPPVSLNASLKCAGPDGVYVDETPGRVPIAENRVIFVDPDDALPYRTCVLDIGYIGAALDVSYGFLALAYDEEVCVDPNDDGPVPVPLDVSFAPSATAPAMTLCPVDFDHFSVTAEFDRLLEVTTAGPTSEPVTGSIDCPGGAGSMGILPIYGRTPSGSGVSTTCTVTVFGASSSVDYALTVTSYPLQDCPDDGSEPNDAIETAVNVVSKGWMTPTAGGVSPPLAVCGASPIMPEDDDWFSFSLTGAHDLMQISFMYDKSVEMGDVDLDVWMPGATETSRFAAQDVTSVPIPTPPAGQYYLRFLCYAPSGPCGNVYRFAITIE